MNKPTKFQKEHPEIRSPRVQHIRSYKPEFFVHEGINEMSVNARYAEIGVWSCCDWHGRFEWKPRTLKLKIMPFDNVDFESLMNEWVEHGFAFKYEVGGQIYGQISNWEKHQAINKREKDSNCVYPAPPEHMLAHARPVLARAMSAGVGTGFGVDSGSGNGNETPLPSGGAV
jgi:hypothetical protein